MSDLAWNRHMKCDRAGQRDTKRGDRKDCAPWQCVESKSCQVPARRAEEGDSGVRWYQEPWQLRRQVGQFGKEGAVGELSVLYPPSLIDAGQVPALLSSRGGLQVVLFFFPFDWLRSLIPSNLAFLPPYMRNDATFFSKGMSLKLILNKTRVPCSSRLPLQMMNKVFIWADNNVFFECHKKTGQWELRKQSG